MGTGAAHSLCKGLIIGAEELEERVRVCLNVEFHLSLFHNLGEVSTDDGDDSRGGKRTSNPASEMRGSISNLWLSAWFLMIATVRVVGEPGLEVISPGA